MHPEKVGHLVTLNALYGSSDQHTLLGPGSPTNDPAHPDRLNPGIGGYAEYGSSSLFGVWTARFRRRTRRTGAPAIAKAYGDAALASDPASAAHDPPAFCAPMGAIEDSFYQAAGRRLFDASSITARLLVVRSGRDFWTRPEDAASLVHDAARSRGARRVDLPEATHFVDLDRPERGRDRLLAETVSFLAGG